jgi:predicted  nucleic acid-binding Zn-ribbon protein
MTAARPEAEIRDELKELDNDLARLRETARSLREQIGGQADGATDQEEHAELIESAEEQEFMADQLETRREELLAELRGPA